LQSYTLKTLPEGKKTVGYPWCWKKAECDVCFSLLRRPPLYMKLLDMLPRCVQSTEFSAEMSIVLCVYRTRVFQRIANTLKSLRIIHNSDSSESEIIDHTPRLLGITKPHLLCPFAPDYGLLFV